MKDGKNNSIYIIIRSQWGPNKRIVYAMHVKLDTDARLTQPSC